MAETLAHYSTEALRLTVWLALLCVVFVPLERLFSLAERRVPWSSRLGDVAFYFVNSLLPAAVLSAIMAQAILLGHLALPAGYFAWVAALPLALTLPVALFVAELGFYWGHRWSHQIPFLWRFHAVHHEPEHIHWMIATRSHPLDIIFVRLCGLTPLYILGLARFGDPRGNLVAAVAIVVGTFWGFFIHANMTWRLGFLEKIVSSPFFHHWHHTREEPINRNYASMIPLFDRLFGTYHMPARWPEGYGIKEERPQPAVSGEGAAMAASALARRSTPAAG